MTRTSNTEQAYTGTVTEQDNKAELIANWAKHERQRSEDRKLQSYIHARFARVRPRHGLEIVYSGDGFW